MHPVVCPDVYLLSSLELWVSDSRTPRICILFEFEILGFVRRDRCAEELALHPVIRPDVDLVRSLGLWV